MDQQMDRQVRQAGCMEHSESQGDNRTSRLGNVAETRDRPVVWPVIGHTKLRMAGEMAGNDRWQYGPVDHCSVPAGPVGTQAHSPSPPSHHPAPPGSQTLGSILACTLHPPPSAGLVLGLPPTPFPAIVPWGAALPETLMGTMLVWMEQDWCHCFSSTVGRWKALVQDGCLSGLVGRLREALGARAPSAVVPTVSSSVARWLGGCGGKGM